MGVSVLVATLYPNWSLVVEIVKGWVSVSVSVVLVVLVVLVATVVVVSVSNTVPLTPLVSLLALLALPLSCLEAGVEGYSNMSCTHLQ